MKTDVLNYVLVKCLSQRNSDSTLIRLVTFYFQKLIKFKQNWEIYNKEIIIIIVLLKKWWFQLEEIFKSFTVLIDYKNLKYFKILKILNKWQAWWKEMLNFYNFIIKYQAKIMNSKADTLFKQINYHLNENINNKQFSTSLLEAEWLILIEADYFILIYLYKDDCLMLANNWIEIFKTEYEINSEFKTLLQQIEKSEEYHAEYNINEIKLIWKNSLLYISDIIKLKEEIL